MNFWGDYHTHTVYSHGKGTILENAEKAVEMGFKELAITDHGFRHMAYNARRRDVPSMQKDIAEAKGQFPELEIYLGLETNLTGIGGQIDIRPSDMEFLDILLCGFHKFVAPNRFGSLFDFYLPVAWANLTRKTSDKLKAKNTEAYINCIIKNDIDIITHINNGIVSDPVEVAKCAKEYGTLIELNAKHINPQDDEFVAMIETGVNFIINSDAHSVDKIGGFEKPLEVVRRFDIPEDRIVNLNKRPVFRSRIKRGLK